MNCLVGWLISGACLRKEVGGWIAQQRCGGHDPSTTTDYYDYYYYYYDYYDCYYYYHYYYHHHYYTAHPALRRARSLPRVDVRLRSSAFE